jgi:hypothetical protein
MTADAKRPPFPGDVNRRESISMRFDNRLAPCVYGPVVRKNSAQRRISGLNVPSLLRQELKNWAGALRFLGDVDNFEDAEASAFHRNPRRSPQCAQIIEIKAVENRRF